LELSGFDPDFFAYTEDTDLGIRAYLKGWECLFEPKAIVYHRYSKTAAFKTGYSSLKLYLVERNRLWILFRYYPVYLILASPITSLIRLIFQALQAVSSKGQASTLAPFSGFLALPLAGFKAFFDAFLSLPKQLKWRKQWLSKKPAKSALFRVIFDHFIPLKQISRLD